MAVARSARWLWVVVVVLLVVVVPGGGALLVMFMNDAQKRLAVRKALRKWAVIGNIDPDLMDAMGYVESKWKLDARSTDPRDEARGGSYGPTQISEKTARGAGYTGDMEALRRDPDLAAEWTAILLNARPGGAPTTPEDTAAWWNSGRRTFAQVPELGKSGKPHYTRAVYAPAMLDAMVIVAENPVEAAA